MLKPVQRTRKHCAAFVPDNLLVVKKTNAKKAVEHLACEFARMPDISNLEARQQFEGFRPIGAGIARDRRLGVAFGAFLQVARLRRAVAVEASSIPPLRI